MPHLLREHVSSNLDTRCRLHGRHRGSLVSTQTLPHAAHAPRRAHPFLRCATKPSLPSMPWETAYPCGWVARAWAFGLPNRRCLPRRNV